jgi:hypothetical protein
MDSKHKSYIFPSLHLGSFSTIVGGIIQQVYLCCTLYNLLKTVIFNLTLCLSQKKIHYLKVSAEKLLQITIYQLSH